MRPATKGSLDPEVFYPVKQHKKMKGLEENIRQLQEQVMELGFAEPWAPLLPAAIGIAAGQEAGTFIGVVDDTGEGKSLLELHFDREAAGRYVFSNYEAGLLLPLPLNLDAVPGPAGRDLDQKMSGMDWTTDTRALEQDLPNMTLARSKQIAEAEEIFLEMMALAATGPEGAQLAAMLQLKHLMFTPYEDLILRDLREAYYRQSTFYVKGTEGISRQEALALLSGRSVRKSFTDGDDFLRTEWFCLEDPRIERSEVSETYFFRGERRFPDYDLEDVLSRLLTVPGTPARITALRDGLRQGRAVKTNMILHGKLRGVRLAANPEIQGVSILDAKGNLLELFSGARAAKTKKQDRGRGKGL